MNDASTQPAKPHAVRVDEPFGQLGVRQFLFPALWWASFILLILSAILAIRSNWRRDQLSLGGGSETIIFRSMSGRLLVAVTHLDAPVGEAMRGASFDSQTVPENVVDRWQPSVWKTIGIEARNEPFQTRGATGGAWLRIKWPTMLALMAVLPMLKGILFLKRLAVALEKRGAPN